MSATIYWRPLKEGVGLKYTSAPSSFQEYLESAFERQFPLRLLDSDLDSLRIAQRLTKDTNFQKDIQELIEAVERHGEIEVWAAW